MFKVYVSSFQGPTKYLRPPRIRGPGRMNETAIANYQYRRLFGYGTNDNTNLDRSPLEKRLIILTDLAYNNSKAEFLP
jgi:hypothetical protein